MTRVRRQTRWIAILAGLLGLLGGRPELAPGADAPAPAPAEVRDDRAVLLEWVQELRRSGARTGASTGELAVRAAELALGSPYHAFTLDSYLEAEGADPRSEPLTLRLDGFDCVTLIETALAASRVARGPAEGEAEVWSAFEREVERQRYRGGERAGYASRLHYFSEWISDGEARGLVRDLGRELGGRADTRPLRFMTTNRHLYAALRHEGTFRRLQEIERARDGEARWAVPADRIDAVAAAIEPGDVIALVSSREGLDVLHTGLAYPDAHGTLRMIHAPLSGGAVEITRGSLQQYVTGVRGADAVLVARPLE